MPDQLSEVTTKGWFERIGESIKGVLVGILLLVAAFPLLWWNEGRSVRNYKSLQEGRGAVISVAAEAVDPANDKSLVHLSGRATTEEKLKDATFGISATALRLSRKVEMYQWVEHVETETKKKIGGKEETEKTYSYTREWQGRLVPSAEFRQPEEHENPNRMRFSSESWMARSVTLGGFTLSEGLKERIKESEPVPVTRDAVAALEDDLREEAQLDGDDLYLGWDPADPSVGDLRISFSKVPPTEVSIVAQQLGNGLGPFQTQAGNRLEMVAAGTVPAEQMFASAEQANVLMTWLLRLAGFVVMLVGLSMVFRPLSVVADVVPLLGNLVGMGTGLVAFAIAAPLSLLTIAAAWVRYRPLLGIGLLVIGAAIFFGLRAMASKRRASAPA